jgi:hypothetical protein
MFKFLITYQNFENGDVIYINSTSRLTIKVRLPRFENIRRKYNINISKGSRGDRREVGFFTPPSLPLLSLPSFLLRCLDNILSPKDSFTFRTFTISQHSSASPALRNIISGRNMPARIWKHGIYSFLELLRYQLPDLLNYILAFVYLAYDIMALLIKSMPYFKRI